MESQRCTAFTTAYFQNIFIAPIAIISSPPFLLTPVPINHESMSLQMNLFWTFCAKGITQMWPFGMASFTKHKVFKVHPRFSMSQHFIPFFKKNLFIYFWREEREKEMKRNINVTEKHWLVALGTVPKWGPTATQYVPQPGIKPAIFCWMGWHPINWTTLVRAALQSLWPNNIPWYGYSTFCLFISDGHFGIISWTQISIGGIFLLEP